MKKSNPTIKTAQATVKIEIAEYLKQLLQRLKDLELKNEQLKYEKENLERKYSFFLDSEKMRYNVKAVSCRQNGERMGSWSFTFNDCPKKSKIKSKR